MSNDKQTAVDWLLDRIEDVDLTEKLWENVKQQAKEMEKEQMRSYIEEKWKQYRMMTNEEDAWLFKEWLIKETYGGNK
jgi:uncharacterized UBP type Zn finger protein